MNLLARIACCALFTAPVASIAQAVEVPPVPLITDRQAFAVLVVPDLVATFANVETTCAAAKLPMPRGLPAKQVGGLLGDPDLRAIAGKPIVAAVAPGMPFPAWCAILPIADPAALAQLTASGTAVAEAVPGGVAVGSAVGGMELAKRIAPSVPALAASVPAGVDARLLLATDRLAQAYLPLLGGLMQQGIMRQAVGSGTKPADAQQQAQAIIALMRAGLLQCGPVCVDIASTPTGWRLDMLSAVAPGPLADAIKPQPAGGAELLQRLPAGASPPIMAGAGRFPAAVYAAMGVLLERARSDPAVAKLVDPSLVQLGKDASRAFDGRIAMRQGAGGNPFQQVGAMGVADAAATTQLLAQVQGLAGNGGLADVLALSGLSLTWKPKARLSGSIAVDSLIYEAIPGKVAPAQEQMMREMLKPQELAVGTDVLAYGSPSADVDQILGGRPSATPLMLRARELPGDWDVRADWDIALQMKQQFAMMAKQMPQMGQMFQGVKGGDPVRIGIAFGDARVRTLVVVPAAMVADLSAARPSGVPVQRAEAAPAPSAVGTPAF